ncbi:MAG TPA: hypothetical protein VJG32_11025 [Anaerolineae bacterium]|nr:hypothetical protein [Anaerolineae bacterium]
MSKNLLVGLGVLFAVGFATWLLLPAVTAPATVAPIPNTSLVVPIGPLQVNLMLIVLFIAGGTPFAAVFMALLVRWFSSKVPTNVAPAASTRRAPATPAAAPAAETAAEELPLAQKLLWWGLSLVGLGAVVFLILQVLPPGFTLF